MTALTCDYLPSGAFKAYTDQWGNLHACGTYVFPGVFKYTLPDGSVRRELKTPEELRKPKFLQSIARAIVTDEHTPFGIPVTSRNNKEFSRGSGHTAEYINHEVVGDLSVTCDKLSDSIKSKRQIEISLGFTKDLDMTPGIWRGVDGKGPPEPYDAVQRNMIANQIAFTREARCGSDARLHLDSSYADLADASKPIKGRKTMTKLEIGGMTVEFEDAGVASLVQRGADKLNERIQSLETDSVDTKKTLDTLQATHDQLITDHKELKEKADKELSLDSIDNDKLNIIVNARMKLMGSAGLFLTGDSLKGVETKSNEDVMRAVLEGMDITLDGKTPGYIEARFDAAVESKNTEQANTNAKAVAGISLTGDSGATDNSARLEKAFDKRDNRWKEPLGVQNGAVN